MKFTHIYIYIYIYIFARARGWGGNIVVCFVLRVCHDGCDFNYVFLSLKYLVELLLLFGLQVLGCEPQNTTIQQHDRGSKESEKFLDGTWRFWAAISCDHTHRAHTCTRMMFVMCRRYRTSEHQIIPQADGDEWISHKTRSPNIFRRIWTNADTGSEEWRLRTKGPTLSGLLYYNLRTLDYLSSKFHTHTHNTHIDYLWTDSVLQVFIVYPMMHSTTRMF